MPPSWKVDRKEKGKTLPEVREKECESILAAQNAALQLLQAVKEAERLEKSNIFDVNIACPETSMLLCNARRCVYSSGFIFAASGTPTCTATGQMGGRAFGA